MSSKRGAAGSGCLTLSVGGMLLYFADQLGHSIPVAITARRIEQQNVVCCLIGVGLLGWHAPASVKMALRKSRPLGVSILGLEG